MRTRRHAVYDGSFYADQQGESYQSARAVLAAMWTVYRPASVIDVGCGIGTWLRAAHELGVDDYLGVDGEYAADHGLWIPPDRFLAHDLTNPLDLGRRFDLAVSVEVAEHLPRDAAATFIRTLTRLAPVVLFSAAVPNQGGDGHLNEQWPGYWASHFSDRGYAAYDCLRARLWDDERIAWWYRQNVVVFTGDGALLADPGPAGDPRALVHPRQIEAILTRPAAAAPAASVPEPSLPTLLRQLPPAAVRATRRCLARVTRRVVARRGRAS